MLSNWGFIAQFMSERGVKLGKCQKCQNYRFFDIFLNILHKLKGNLGQNNVKGEPPSFQGKKWNNFPCYPWKNNSFFQFCPYFSTLLSLKSGFST